MGHGWCRMIKGWGSGWACGAGTIALWRIKGRHILCRGCPPFAHPAVARAMGLEPGSLSLATHQRTHCQDRLPQSPRSRPLHHEQSCPAAASASADRSSRLLHFLPAPTDTLRPSPGLSPHRQTSCSSPRTHSTMSTQQQAMVLDTILAIKRTLKRKAYGMQLAACAARPHPPTLLLGGPGLTAMAPRRLRRLGRLDRVHDQPRQQAQKDGEICEKRPPDIIEWSRRVQGGLLTPGPAPLGETPRADPPR